VPVPVPEPELGLIRFEGLLMFDLIGVRFLRELIVWS